MKKHSGMFLAACLIACTSFADGNVWWVDDDNYGKSGLDGTSAEKAFGTIQDAIDNADCTDGDTIKVMPGTYDQDYTGSDGVRRRVYVNKRLTIEATGSKNETHIVGRFCPVEEGGDPDYGTGPAAVRCVFVDSAGIGSYLKGFTLRSGASRTESGSGTAKNNGGAVVVNASDALSQFYVVDCVISNCVSKARGGAAFGGTFIRCWISDCRAYRDVAFMNSSVINCVISRCRAAYGNYKTIAYSSCKFANCTFYGNTCAQLETDNYRNCLFVGNGSTETTATGAVGSNIYATQGMSYSNAKPIQLFAPAIGDFHPLQDSDVFGAGETRYLTTECPVILPAGMELRDMDGELIDLTKETCSVGAYQSAKIPEYGGVLLPEDMIINGFPTYGSNFLFATSWPISVKVSRSNGLPFNFSETGEAGEARVRCAGMDKYVSITPPYKAGAITTNEFVQTLSSSTLSKRYVDAVNGNDDENDGTSASPYATIQKAIDSNSSSKLLYVYVGEGDYRVGGVTDRGVTNRVHIGYQANMHIVATGDRAKTIIRGATARNERNHAKHPGCGPDAVRCVSYSFPNAVYDSTVAFVGFTFADGHTDVGQNADNDMGGAALGRPEKRTTLQFVDCVFTNCYAPAAGVGAQAMFTRCRFIDCGGSADGFRNSVLTSSIVESGNFGTGVLGSDTCSVGSSIAGPRALATGCVGQMVLNTAAGEDGALPSSAVTFGSTALSCFADAANGDFRPVSGSPALDASRRKFPSPGDSAWDVFATAFSDFAADGIDGSGWIYSGAYPIAGACMGWVSGVSLALADASGYVITGGKAGGNLMSPGDILTIERSPTATRRWGIVVNGVTNTLDKASCVYVYEGNGGMNDVAIYSIRLPSGFCITYR